MAKKTSKTPIKKKLATKVVKIVKPTAAVNAVTKPVVATNEKEEKRDELAPISKEVEKALEEVDEKVDELEVPVVDEIPDVMTEEDFSPDIDEADTKEEW
ncbi:MAG: hypothetical protein WCO79_00105 [bacterium]